MKESDFRTPFFSSYTPIKFVAFGLDKSKENQTTKEARAYRTRKRVCEYHFPIAITENYGLFFGRMNHLTNATINQVIFKIDGLYENLISIREELNPGIK